MRQCNRIRTDVVDNVDGSWSKITVLVRLWHRLPQSDNMMRGPEILPLCRFSELVYRVRFVAFSSRKRP